MQQDVALVQLANFMSSFLVILLVILSFENFQTAQRKLLLIFDQSLSDESKLKLIFTHLQ